MWIVYLHIGAGALIPPRGAAAICIEAGQSDHCDPVHAGIPHVVRRRGKDVAGVEDFQVEHADHGRPAVLLVGIQLVNKALQLLLEGPAAELEGQVTLLTPERHLE